MAKKQTSAKFRFKISYEASLLTLITFLISIASLSWQIINYFEGAQVRLITPDQITIGSSPRMNYPNRGGGPYVHFITRMSYVNAASAGYNATVSVERVSITVDGQHTFEYRWYYFVTSDAVGKDGTELDVKKTLYAQPFALAAGSSASHETFFSLGRRTVLQQPRHALRQTITSIGRPSCNGSVISTSSNSNSSPIFLAARSRYPANAKSRCHRSVLLNC